MKKSLKSLYILLAIAALVLATLACGSSTSTSEAPAAQASEPAEVEEAQPTEEPEQAAVPEPTQPPAPTATPEPPAELYLGDAVQGDGYALTAVTVADPATPGILYQAEAGKKLVAVELVIANVSGEVLSANPLYAELVDGDGFVYTLDLVGVDNQLGSLELSPGEQARGWVAFKIPEGATAASIKYNTDVFGIENLQASLQPAPEGHTPVTAAITPVMPASGLGETVEQDGYALTANTVEDPAPAGILYTDIEGYKLVAVEVTLQNTAGATPLNSNVLYSYLVDTNGFVYAPDLMGRDGQMATVDLNTGESVKGWISFTIPEDATPAYIKYQTVLFPSTYLIVGIR